MIKQLVIDYDLKKYTFTQLHYSELAYLKNDLENYIKMTQEEKTYMFIELAYKSLQKEHSDITIEDVIKILGEDEKRAQKLVDFVFDFNVILLN